MARKRTKDKNASGPKKRGIWPFRSSKAKRRRPVFRILFWLCSGLSIAMCVAVILVAFINPPHGVYMSSEARRLGSIKQVWTNIDDLPPYMARSVVAAEDANFCIHNGFDFDAIRQALEENGLRGASTISQQVAKNVFLWHGRNWTRKGFEVVFTVLIELFWTKERIVEVYLNVAEFDEGVFGVGAAGRHYFGVSGPSLSKLQAGRLAAVLPSPQKWSASKPTSYVRKRTRGILAGADTILVDGRADCF